MFAGTCRPRPKDAAANILASSPQINIVTTHSNRNRVNARSPVRKNFSAAPGKRAAIAKSSAPSPRTAEADADDGTIPFRISAGVKQRDISVRRAGHPQVEQPRILRDRAGHRPNTEVAEPELTHDVRRREQIQAVAAIKGRICAIAPTLSDCTPAATCCGSSGASWSSHGEGGYASRPSRTEAVAPWPSIVLGPRSF